MMKMLLLLLLLLFATSMQYVSTIDIPPIGCPKIFQYVNRGGKFFGTITLSDLKREEINIDLRFQQRQQITNNNLGDLILDADIFETDRNLKYGKPIVYRLDFPLQSELPKILAITVNGIQICSGDDYPDFEADVTLSHTFFPANNAHIDHRNVDAANEVTTTTATTKEIPNRIESVPIAINLRFNSKTDKSTFNAECGLVESETTAYVSGGEELRRGDFPWLVPVFRKINGGLQFICGSSLISRRTILTAAHCITLLSLSAQDIVVILGKYNLQSFSEEGIDTTEIDKIVIHKEYKQNNFPDADLALLQLSKPAIFSFYVKPICLWSGPDDDRLINGMMAQVAGWGGDGMGIKVTPLPTMVNVPIVSEIDCVKSDPAFMNLTSPRTICAGQRDGSGPCLGDSGAGLMIQRDDRWMVRGVVSAGAKTSTGMCNLNSFVIYCDVAKHMSWLKNNMLD